MRINADGFRGSIRDLFAKLDMGNELRWSCHSSQYAMQVDAVMATAEIVKGTGSLEDLFRRGVGRLRLYGIPVVVDMGVPNDELRLVKADSGEVLLTIFNLGTAQPY